MSRSVCVLPALWSLHVEFYRWKWSRPTDVSNRNVSAPRLPQSRMKLGRLSALRYLLLSISQFGSLTYMWSVVLLWMLSKTRLPDLLIGHSCNSWTTAIKRHNWKFETFCSYNVYVYTPHLYEYPLFQNYTKNHGEGVWRHYCLFAGCIVFDILKVQKSFFFKNDKEVC